jgi:hypothetical protein
MIGQRGRIRKIGFVDGDLVPLAKIIKFGSAKCVTLPKEWLDVVNASGKLEYLSITINSSMIILKPYYGEIGDK